MSLASLMNQTIQIAHRTGYDVHGKPVYGTAANVACRFRPAMELQLGKEGSEERLDATAIVDGSTVVSLDDDATFGNTTYKVTHVIPAVVGSGSTHHLTLGLQRWGN